MRKLRPVTLVLLFPALLAGATPAVADEPRPKEELVCKANKATGSRIRVNKRCLTQSEWDRLELETRKAVNDFSVRSSANQGGGGSSTSGGPL